MYELSISCMLLAGSRRDNALQLPCIKKCPLCMTIPYLYSTGTGRKVTLRNLYSAKGQFVINRVYVMQDILKICTVFSRWIEEFTWVNCLELVACTDLHEDCNKIFLNITKI